MENSRFGAFLRSRRLESFLSTSSDKRVLETPKVSVKDESEQRPRRDFFVDDDGWVPVIISWFRIVTCFVSMMVTTFIWALIMLVLIPWPYERIRQGNIYGHVTGRMLGFVHLALQSRLPIVPMVLTGTHLAWRKGSLHVRPAPLTVKYLPPISTENWTVNKIDDYVKMLHNLYAGNLPKPQRPLP